jgi:hypothetical protein
MSLLRSSEEYNEGPCSGQRWLGRYSNQVPSEYVTCYSTSIVRRQQNIFKSSVRLGTENDCAGEAHRQFTRPEKLNCRAG